jgi:hypothetical protein
LGFIPDSASIQAFSYLEFGWVLERINPFAPHPFYTVLILIAKMEELQVIQSILATQNELLQILIVLNSLIFGSLLFVHFGRFMRW